MENITGTTLHCQKFITQLQQTLSWEEISPQGILANGEEEKILEELYGCLNNSLYPEKQVMQLGTQKKMSFFFDWRVYFGSQDGGGEICVHRHKYFSYLFPAQPSELAVGKKVESL